MSHKPTRHEVEHAITEAQHTQMHLNGITTTSSALCALDASPEPGESGKDSGVAIYTRNLMDEAASFVTLVMVSTFALLGLAIDLLAITNPEEGRDLAPEGPTFEQAHAFILRALGIPASMQIAAWQGSVARQAADDAARVESFAGVGVRQRADLARALADLLILASTLHPGASARYGDPAPAKLLAACRRVFIQVVVIAARRQVDVEEVLRRIASELAGQGGMLDVMDAATPAKAPKESAAPPAPAPFTLSQEAATAAGVAALCLRTSVLTLTPQGDGKPPALAFDGAYPPHAPQIERAAAVGHIIVHPVDVTVQTAMGSRVVNHHGALRVMIPDAIGTLQPLTLHQVPTGGIAITLNTHPEPVTCMVSASFFSRAFVATNFS